MPEIVKQIFRILTAIIVLVNIGNKAGREAYIKEQYLGIETKHRNTLLLYFFQAIIIGIFILVEFEIKMPYKNLLILISATLISTVVFLFISKNNIKNSIKGNIIYTQRYQAPFVVFGCFFMLFYIPFSIAYFCYFKFNKTYFFLSVTGILFGGSIMVIRDFFQIRKLEKELDMDIFENNRRVWKKPKKKDPRL